MTAWALNMLLNMSEEGKQIYFNRRFLKFNNSNAD
jgi:hypothetical protein